MRMRAPSFRPRAGVCGSALVEFSLSSFLLLLVLFAGLEFGRMALVYTTVANAARAGLRYAAVHGALRDPIGGVDGASGPAANPTQVVTAVKNFASAGLLDTSRLVISVSYPNNSNAVGAPVTVTVVYPYDPFTTYLPLRVRIGSTSQGVIAF